MSHPKAEEENIIPFRDDDVEKSQVHVDDYKSAENPIPSQEGNESQFPSFTEEEITKKKYGGLLRKKPPLISMGHEHAFFDSADWELRKQGGQKSKGLLEKLRPKLEPTPHHQLGSRRLSYDPSSHNGEGCKDSVNIYTHEDQKRSIDNDNDKDGQPDNERDGDHWGPEN